MFIDYDLGEINSLRVRRKCSKGTVDRFVAFNYPFENKFLKYYADLSEIYSVDEFYPYKSVASFCSRNSNIKVLHCYVGLDVYGLYMVGDRCINIHYEIGACLREGLDKYYLVNENDGFVFDDCGNFYLVLNDFIDKYVSIFDSLDESFDIIIFDLQCKDENDLI